jgi:hypothetical protein
MRSMNTRAFPSLPPTDRDDDPDGGDDLVGGCLQGDGEADAVGSGPGAGVDRVHGDADDRLVDGEQGVHLLVDVGRMLGAQDPTVQLAFRS